MEKQYKGWCEIGFCILCDKANNKPQKGKIMRTVFKYELTPCKNFVSRVAMPQDAEFLHVCAIGDRIFLWAEVDTESSITEYNFDVLATGGEIRDEDGIKINHVGSVIMYGGTLVFHIYHRVNC